MSDKADVVVDPRLVALRDFSEGDVGQLTNYWYHSPPGFIEAMGIDPKKLRPELEFEKWMINECRVSSFGGASKLHSLAITYEGKAIGNHAVSPLIEGNYGVFHAHIWNPEMRGKGIATITYPEACLIFMERFKLKRMLFKTPIQNIGAIHIKVELGIRCVGEELVSFGIIRDGTLAKVFELTRPEAESLIKRH